MVHPLRPVRVALDRAEPVEDLVPLHGDTAMIDRLIHHADVTPSKATPTDSKTATLAGVPTATAEEP